MNLFKGLNGCSVSPSKKVLPCDLGTQVVEGKGLTESQPTVTSRSEVTTVRETDLPFAETNNRLVESPRVEKQRAPVPIGQAPRWSMRPIVEGDIVDLGIPGWLVCLPPWEHCERHGPGLWWEHAVSGDLCCVACCADNPPGWGSFKNLWESADGSVLAA